MAADTKRQNFNITPEQEAEIAWLREELDAPTTKDAILRAVRVVAALARETRGGAEVFLHTPHGSPARLLIPELERVGAPWTYLVSRPHPWRRELWVKGRRVRASQVWASMCANGDTLEDTAVDWDLPIEAVREIVAYCLSHRDLVAMEAEEELRRLGDEVIAVGPAAAA